MKEALERFEVIRPFIEDGVPLPEVVREQNVSLRTAREWVERYRKYGLEGLNRKGRSDKGKLRRLPEELEQLTEAFALEKPRLSVATIHRKICTVAHEKGLIEPSYSVIYNIISQLDPALLKLAHEGSKSYGNTHDLVYRRESNVPNELWQADHSVLDILVLNENGKAAKPWLTIIIDDYSRAVCGYFISFNAPCALHTALAFRQAIWRKGNHAWQVCGIPQALYTDNGSDFISKHIEQVCIDLKIRTHFSLPGKPRGRGRIERFFSTITQMLLMNLEGYSPNGIQDVKAVLGLEELAEKFENFIVQEYHHRPHSTTGITPLERWTEKGFVPNLPKSLEQLDILLLTVSKSRRVQRDGIRFQGLRYIDTLLASYVGEDVTIRYDPRDVTDIRVYYKDQFLCRAVCQELSGETVSLKDIIKARNARKRELQNTIDNRRSLLDTLLESSSLKKLEPSERLETQHPKQGKQEEKPTRAHGLKLYRND